LTAQSLRELIETSINGDVTVKLEVASGDIRDVMFVEFVLNDKRGSRATGMTDGGNTTVVVLLPRKVLEARRSPLVVLGQ
jgi:hypothetical protein